MFLLLFLTSGSVGLSDDESYYWVLAQKPALGYAYHPPMVAWMIFAAQKTLGGWLGASSPWVVRFFSCACMGLFFFLALDWGKRSSKNFRPVLFSLVLASFAGIFGLGWMMVPDVPLILGWVLAFHASLEIGGEIPSRRLRWSYVRLALGVCIAILGKYSGVLVPFSAVLGIALVLDPKTRKQRLLRAFLAAAVGTVLGLVPIVIWNSQHEWQSVLYQIQERHQDAELSWKRYLRFWLIEFVAAGPPLVIYTFGLIRRALRSSRERLAVFAACWIAPPALIYCIQPLWSDFKPHWAFIVWLPGALVLAWEASRGKKIPFLRTQRVYGLLLITAVWTSLHVPVMSAVLARLKGPDFDPRLDVTNDLYGWDRFAEFVSTHRGPDGVVPDVAASRYQTASQAAAALGKLDHVTLLPRDLKSRDEWPVLPVTTDVGPEWPELMRPVLYVGDNRYDAPPAFRSSRCVQLNSLETRRGRFLAKRILLWDCKPISWPD